MVRDHLRFFLPTVHVLPLVLLAGVEESNRIETADQDKLMKLKDYCLASMDRAAS